MALNITTLNQVPLGGFVYRYAECRNAECRNAECRYAECRGAKNTSDD
jgi:hypothetical protein